MARSDDRIGRLGSLFVTVTGQSTITERQTVRSSRCDDRGEEGELSRYLGRTIAANGLDDAIQVPEEY